MMVATYKEPHCQKEKRRRMGEDVDTVTCDYLAFEQSKVLLDDTETE